MLKSKYIENGTEWNEIINSFENNDVYFFYDYFLPFSNYGDGKPGLFFFENEHGKVAYPFMLRDLNKVEKLSKYIQPNELFDIISVYGYGGPLYEVYTTLTDLQDSFLEEFSIFCSQKKIITQFDRFHPLYDNYLLFEGYSDIIALKNTIAIDVSDSESIWMNQESNARNMIRKAEKNNVRIVIDDDISTLSDFKTIYLETMKNNNASNYYYFNEQFFTDTCTSLGDKLILVNAYYEDEIISSTMILVSNQYIHYHLSGTKPKFRHLQSTSLMIYEIAMWASQRGKSLFHLGGGYSDVNDSLYRFKKTFTKDGTYGFYLGKKIHNDEIYQELNNYLKLDKQSNFFPKYRL